MRKYKFCQGNVPQHMEFRYSSFSRDYDLSCMDRFTRLDNFLIGLYTDDKIFTYWYHDDDITRIVDREIVSNVLKLKKTKLGRKFFELNKEKYLNE